MKRVFRKRNAQTLPHIDRHIARIDVHRRSIISGRYDRTVFQNTFYGRIGREDQPHRLLIIAVDDHQERATVVFQQRNHGSQPFRFENVDRFGQLGQPLRTARNRFAGMAHPFDLRPGENARQRLDLPVHLPHQIIGDRPPAVQADRSELVVETLRIHGRPVSEILQALCAVSQVAEHLQPQRGDAW